MCGSIHDIKLHNRTMICDCGNIMDRDLNAAINLRNPAVSSTVTACGEVSSDIGNISMKLSSMKQEI